MLQCPVTKQFSLAIYTLKCGLVSEWVGWANPIFSSALGSTTSQILGQPWSSKFSHSLSLKLARNLQHFGPCCKVFTLYICRKNVGKLNVIQTFAVPHNYMKMFWTPKQLFCQCVPFWRKKWVSLNITINKKSHFLENFFLRAQCLKQLKTCCFKSRQIWKCRQKEIYAETKEYPSHVGSKYEFGPRPIL